VNWCEHCREFAADHYDADGKHRVGSAFGAYGRLLAAEQQLHRLLAAAGTLAAVRAEESETRFGGWLLSPPIELPDELEKLRAAITEARETLGLCGARAVFWPDDEACDAECCLLLGHRPAGVHEDEILGEWDEDELPTTPGVPDTASHEDHHRHIVRSRIVCSCGVPRALLVPAAKATSGDDVCVICGIRGVRAADPPPSEESTP
jgi:hypothetical protein